MATDKDTIVFSDIKKSLTLGQFEAIQAVALRDYNTLAKGFRAKEKFEAGAGDKMDDMGEMPEGLAKKLIDGIIRRAEKEFFKLFEEEIKRHEDILDFLNTFRASDNQLDKLI